MTIIEYNNLQGSEQYEILWEHGFIIGEKVKGDYDIMLYQLFSFYVEVYYIAKNNLLKRLKTFSNIKSFNSYRKKYELKIVDSILNATL